MRITTTFCGKEGIMWLDINAYVGHWPFHQVRYNTCRTLLERMEQFGVELSVVANMNAIFYKNTQSANEELMEEIRSERRFRDRFIPFAIINPSYAGWRNDLKTCVEKWGMKGVRVYPKYHDYEVTDPSLIELVKRARDYGIPVTFQIRVVDSRSRSWMDISYVNGKASPKKEWTVKNILPVMKAVPDAKYMILNVANGILVAKGEDMELIRKAEIVFDTSGRQASNLENLLNIYGNEKFAFGSHSPFFDYLTGMLRIAALRETEADESCKALLRSGNAKRILGIA